MKLPLLKKIEQKSWEWLIEELNDEESAIIGGGIAAEASGSCTQFCGVCDISQDSFRVNASQTLLTDDLSGVLTLTHPLPKQKLYIDNSSRFDLISGE